MEENVKDYKSEFWGLCTLFNKTGTWSAQLFRRMDELLNPLKKIAKFA